MTHPDAPRNQVEIIGSAPIELGTAGRAVHGAFSPDGTRYVAAFDNRPGNGIGDGATPPPLDLVDLETGGVTPLARAGTGLLAGTIAWVDDRVFYPSFSPGGSVARPFVVFDVDAGTSTAVDLGISGGVGVLALPGRNELLVFDREGFAHVLDRGSLEVLRSFQVSDQTSELPFVFAASPF